MEELVNKYIKETKKEDFAEIYKLTFNDLYRFVLSKTNNREVTEEVVSDTYFLLIDIIKNYDSSKSRFKTFLFGIALNKLRQQWDSQKAYKSFSLNEDIYIEEIYEESPKRKELFKRILSTLPLLKDKYRLVIQKRFLESKSIKDVSKELNITETNVTTIQNRALNKIKKILENEKI